MPLTHLDLNQQLLWCISQKNINLDQLKTLLRKGTDLNQQCTTITADIEENLTDLGLVDTIIRLPLHVAVTRGSLPATKALLNAGADVNIVHKDEGDDVPVIVRAVDNIDLRMVKLLLKYKPHLIGTASDCSYTGKQDKPSLNIPWRVGLNLKQRAYHCQQPFQHAIDRLNVDNLWNISSFISHTRNLHRRRQIDGRDIKWLRDNLILIIRLLLKNQADTFHILKFHKCYPESWLMNIDSGCYSILLLDTLCSSVPLKDRSVFLDMFISDGDARQVETILKYNPTVVNYKYWNYSCKHKYRFNLTPLMIAASRGYLPLVKTLLTHGADWNDLDRDGFNVLYYALINRRPKGVQVVKYFCREGVSQNFCGKTGPLVHLVYTPPKPYCVLDKDQNTFERRTEMFRALLLAGWKPEEGLLETRNKFLLPEWEDNPLYKLIDFATTPHVKSLLTTSRNVIRETMSPGVLKKVERIALPKKLKELILLSELDNV